MTCNACSRPMMPDHGYRASRPEARVGIRRHRARGLCSGCYESARLDGTIIDHEPRNNPRDVLLDEALWLVQERDLRYRDLPVALGMTRGALTRAVRRGVQRNDPRAIALAKLNTYPTKEAA